MESSHLIQSTNHSVASPDGRHLATLKAELLEIRRTYSLDTVRSIKLHCAQARCVSLDWSPVCKGTGSASRILVAFEDTVRVFDLDDNEWSATIDNGAGGMGSIASAEFGMDDTEVLVFSSFQAQLSIWNLWSGHSVEIRDPRFVAKSNGRSRVFALLSRPSTQDIVTLHAPVSYEVLKTFTLPTVDAQGLKWSPDGRWLAVWDAASAGYRVLIYTADGNLYRTYTGDYLDDQLAGLGVKTVEWSPSGDFLAIGAHETSVTLLSTRTFSPAMHLAHANTLSPYTSSIFLETASSASPSSHSYTLATSPISPPTAHQPPSSSTSNTGPSLLLAFNNTGSLLASKSETHPSTVWIWDLSAQRSRAVFVQHAAVRRLAWHPLDPDLLLVQSAAPSAPLHVWSARVADAAPRVLPLPPAVRLSARADARWLSGPSHCRPALVFADAQGAAIVWPDGRDADGARVDGKLARTSDAEDSLFDILAGRAANVEEADPTVACDFEDGGTVQDTFDFRRGVSAH